VSEGLKSLLKRFARHVRDARPFKAFMVLVALLIVCISNAVGLVSCLIEQLRRKKK